MTKQITGKRSSGKAIAPGYQFGKIIAGVQGIVTVTEITQIEQRGTGLHPNYHYKAEWKAV